MTMPRRIANALLGAIARVAPPAAHEWCDAMLRELDFIPGDWPALKWALGSAVAITRHAARNWRLWLAHWKSIQETGQEDRMNSKGKKAVGIVSGAVGALMLVGCAFALLRITDLVFPRLGIAHTEWTHWLAVIFVPEVIFLAAAIGLWRKKGPVAAGILLVAITIGLHFVVHVAGH